jgi:hypothetical protein
MVGDSLRPAWLQVALGEGDAKPFVANMRLGKKITIGDTGGRRRGSQAVELLKTAGYHYAIQRFPEGQLVTAFLPDLFQLDPGMVDPAGVAFVVLPTVAWQHAQLETLGAGVAEAVAHVDRIGMVDHPESRRDRWEQAAYPSAEAMAALVPIAGLFAAYLDRRTRAPIVADIRFHLQLLLAFLKEGLAVGSVENMRTGGRGHEDYGLAEVGMLSSIAVRASHETIEKLLAEQVSLYFGDN